MSTEEEASKPAAPAADAGAATTSEPEKNGDADGRKQQRRDDRKKDETPIEDLFDLSQPIPRVRTVYIVDAARNSVAGYIFSRYHASATNVLLLEGKI